LTLGSTVRILHPTMTSSHGFAELDGLADLFQRTRALLDAHLATGDLPTGGLEVLADGALPYIERVGSAYRARLRAAEAGLEELRALVLQSGLGLPEPRDAAEGRAALIEAIRARSGAGGEPMVVPPPEGGRTALEHARLALAVLPRIPPQDVHYPAGPRTYADLAAPRTPGEFVGRVEEIERALWLLATRHDTRRQPNTIRRVYGFFDAGEQLSRQGFRPH
jgi:hypothetical protein